ncbi:MAG TPA: protein kinase, partial [Gemmatales bacterium]|nr:protein kinase [Gemmatales bacterium]
ERFFREARAAAALDHANIVRLHDIAQGSGVHFLVMEYVDGVTLQHLLERAGAMHYTQAVQYAAQVTAGLQHAHEKGFVHRDIKPANLILEKGGVVKILDMGLARSYEKPEDNLTANFNENTVQGTV